MKYDTQKTNSNSYMQQTSSNVQYISGQTLAILDQFYPVALAMAAFYPSGLSQAYALSVTAVKLITIAQDTYYGRETENVDYAQTALALLVAQDLIIPELIPAPYSGRLAAIVYNLLDFNPRNQNDQYDKAAESINEYIHSVVGSILPDNVYEHDET